MKAIKIIAIIIFLPILLLVGITTCLYLSASIDMPVLEVEKSAYSLEQKNDTVFCKDSYLYENDYGIWELNVKGSGAEKGTKTGILTQDLLKYQEDVFINKIKEIVPSDKYLSFLRVLTVVFNRNIAEHIHTEYLHEIAAISQFCTDEYNAIGTPYERQVNYHAAHDIGHAMQQYMLVGCSSFGVWNDKSSNGELLVGRNFDFYVGDDFAKNKIVTFATPDSGYKYASIGWAGMIGVLSGMNSEGLTVTINAAKGAMPMSSATPISILARDILQYASTIAEAYEIASKYETFVSESILIGSRNDNLAAIIEKTPNEIALYSVDDNEILCTNHYQSELLYDTEYNQANIKDSDSQYRYERLQELVDSYDKIDYNAAISILRNRYGKNNADVGIGNEMTLNQSIAHHSVVFATTSNKMWMTTEHWQSGKMICYDLDDFFNNNGLPYIAEEYNVEADSLFVNNDLPKLLEYRKGISEIKNAIKHDAILTQDFINNFISTNNNHYYVYRILGDYYDNIDDVNNACAMYEKALARAIPYNSERVEILGIVNKE